MFALRTSLSIVVVVVLSSPLFAERILDPSYYNDHTYNLLTFNIDGNGNEIGIGKGGIVLIPDEEYSKQGISRINTAYWGHDSLDEFTELIDEYATAPIYCHVADRGHSDPSFFEFDPPVRSFGTWIFHNTGVDRPIFKAYDTNSQLIEVAAFDDDAIDEVRKVDGATIEVGFMGIAADREIAYITFPEGSGGAIDDFYYSPEPSAAALLLLAGAGALRRR